MKILIIGDVHGEDIIWDLADLEILSTFPNLDTEFDYYIFLGDYVDSYVITAPKIIDNLEKIIQLKRNYPDKVITLIGNHDLSYMFGHSMFPCSGQNVQYTKEIADLLRANQDIFQPLFYLENLLFTHAGISQRWLKEFNQQAGITDGQLHPNAIAEAYYKSVSEKPMDIYNAVFDVGQLRGGDCLVGGIFWADFRETVLDIVPNWHQVVGHTPMKKIKTIQYCKDDIDMGSITYINTIPSTTTVSEIAYAIEI